MKTILAPLDGSAVAEQVLPFVRRLARILTARVHLLLVITDTQKHHLIAHFAAAPAGGVGQYETDWQWEQRAHMQLAHAAEAYLTEQAQALRTAGLEVTFEVTSGAPAERIVDSATREPQALIAMATQGYSGLRRWTLGSVADKLLHASPVPLLLVRARPSQAEEREKSGQAPITCIASVAQPNHRGGCYGFASFPTAPCCRAASAIRATGRRACLAWLADSPDRRNRAHADPGSGRPDTLRLADT